MLPTFKTLIAILTLATAILAQGCSGLTFWPWKLQSDPPDPPQPALMDGHPIISTSARPSELSGGEDAVRLQMVFEVLRVDIPVLGIRHSLKIWNHVDESQSDPGTTALLARNGLRIGTASADAWPALRTLFETNHARSLHTRHAVQGVGPLSLRLGELGAGEPLFEYQRDGRLVGQTFDGGTKFLHIDYMLDPADPACTIVKVTLELRKFSTTRHWRNVDGVLREVPDYEGKLFSQLSAEVSLGQGESLVIGPSETATMGSLVASRFLTFEENNVTYETVICLTPQVVRMD